MPDKASSVVSYAAGASLAAVALIYVFGPTFAIDHDASSSSKKKTIVGLRNQANDCFINSVLQVLAGLSDLRVYLIRETHRRRIEDPAVYSNLVQPVGTAQLEQWKLQGLQDGLVTQGLKDMLDALNERPLYKKSISPFPLVRVLEVAFKQRISRQQQDAQEFLQIVAERLKDEYHAGQRARSAARKQGLLPSATATDTISTTVTTDSSEHRGDAVGEDRRDFAAALQKLETLKNGCVDATDGQSRVSPDAKDGFPMEGAYESQLECQTCGYKTKPKQETFCTLTLAVPQVSSTTLNACFDGVFKTEYVDDFKCEMCRLIYVRATLEDEMARSTSESFKAQAKSDISRLQEAIDTDPEQPPKGVDLGDIRYAPKRRIAKTTRISIFPKILAIHLSRSIYGISQMTQKNFAKVAFPEELPLGGLLDQHQYKLLGTVTHRGGHNSGHYEAFRRQQNPSSPVHNSNTFQQSDVYSKTSTPTARTPEIVARPAPSPTSITSMPDAMLSPSPTPLPLPPSRRSVPADASRDSSSPQPISKDKDMETSSLRSVAASTKSALSRKLAGPPVMGAAKKAKRRKPPADKWWRVSDEKVQETKTAEVLGMQREVYLLFYELEK